MLRYIVDVTSMESSVLVLVEKTTRYSRDYHHLRHFFCIDYVHT